MDFRSDNTAGASPAILAALASANAGTDSPYGADAVTARLQSRFAALFEHEVAVFPVATGTAANALALAALAPPWGAIFCHENAHVAEDECGAPEFFSGAKLVTMSGAAGKITPEAIAAHMGTRGFVHHAQPAAISISETTEAGAVYHPEEIAALGAFARKEGLGLHVDGARFANAVAALQCAPADLTWRAGVDALSFGATKNGALAAEAVILFDPAKSEELGYRRKRGGHLFSKMRFVSAQLEVYVTDDLWLENARHANRMAARLAAGLERLPRAQLLFKVDANEVFVVLPEPVLAALDAAGAKFYRQSGGRAPAIRLVASFMTREDEVDEFLAVCRRALAA
ncbi:MAG TPA: low specificity L-threonine aldolase [Stellaceae bacterium]|nr:low specificity L-threonine aldolase [Stellaceae bacterium]